MLEKLLENWLDSASERSYQAVFVQMLSAEGYKVLHSTRHCTLEYGKDVLAVAPDGVGCVFQLKGDPKGKMNVNSFRGMQFQIVQMLTQRPSFPGFPAGKFRAYLVSNGEFNEEVQIAARELNDSSYPARLELWSRGVLLDFCKRHSALLWPSEIVGTRALLEIYMAEAGDPLPTRILNEMLSSILFASQKQLKNSELDRAVISACWATGIGISQFSENRNHYAVASGWMLCWALIRAAQGSRSRISKRVKQAASICEAAILDALVELWQEVKDRKHLGEGSPIADMEIYNWRISVLVGLFSVLAFANAERRILSEDSGVALTNWLKLNEEKVALWGEGAISQLFPWVVFLKLNGSQEKAKSLLISILMTLIQKNLNDDEPALPTPHYTFEEIQRDRIGVRKAAGLSLSDKETFNGSSFCAELILRSAVLLGYVNEAKAIWPQFTKFGHRYFEHKVASGYWMFHASRGTEVTKIYPNEYSVSSILEDITGSLESDVALRNWPDQSWLAIMWWQVAPHRLTSSAGCKLLKIAEAIRF